MEFIYLLSKYSHIRQGLYLSSDRIQEQHGYQRVCTVKLPNTNSLSTMAASGNPDIKQTSLHSDKLICLVQTRTMFEDLCQRPALYIIDYDKLGYSWFL